MSSSPVVAIACCRATADTTATDLYPDLDSELLADRIGALGAEAELVAWDSEVVDWARFASVVVRSTWDGIDRPREYLDWIRQVDTFTHLHNPAAIIAWNIDKTYLRDLAVAGVPTIPTTWVVPGEQWRGGGTEREGELIIKPAIGSGARNTARYSPDSLVAAKEHIAALSESGQTVMVQDYFPSVEDRGETSIIFIGGHASHAVRKGGFLNVDEGILEKPWERMTYLGPCDATDRQMAIAEHAFGVVQKLDADSIIYGRVDLIDDSSGSPVVIEVELIDPYLYLQATPTAADLMAAAIVDLLDQPGHR